MTRRRLWAPWRLGYIRSARNPKRSSACLFCGKGRSRSDRSNQVLRRVEYAFLLLNRYPYTNGHLLIAPFRHVGRPERLRNEEWLDLIDLMNDGIDRLQRTMKPSGYNIGLNLGRVAGAGIPGHLHLHIVPRWKGDTNFMPALADVRVISQSLEDAYTLLHRAGRGKARLRTTGLPR